MNRKLTFLLLLALALIVGSLMAASSTRDQAQVWEYKLVEMPPFSHAFRAEYENALNNLGSVGWEIAPFTDLERGRYLMFKRPAN